MKDEVVLDPNNPDHAKILDIIEKSMRHIKTKAHKDGRCKCRPYRPRRRK